MWWLLAFGAAQRLPSRHDSADQMKVKQLFRAVEFSDAETVRSLVLECRPRCQSCSARCADVNAIRSSDPLNQTVLHVAASMGDRRVLRMLESAWIPQRGIDGVLDAVDAAGRTAVDVAEMRGNIGIMQLLLLYGRGRGSRETPEDPDGRRACRPEAVDSLLTESGAVPLVPCVWTRSVDAPALLHVAAYVDSAAGVTQLLEQGADFMAEDLAYRIPAHYAAMEGSQKALAALLEAMPMKAVDRVDEELLTPLHLACAHGHYKCAKQLLQARSNARGQPDLHGKTPRDLAAGHGYGNVVELLDTFVWRMQEDLSTLVFPGEWRDSGNLREPPAPPEPGFLATTWGLVVVASGGGLGGLLLLHLLYRYCCRGKGSSYVYQIDDESPSNTPPKPHLGKAALPATVHEPRPPPRPHGLPPPPDPRASARVAPRRASNLQDPERGWAKSPASPTGGREKRRLLPAASAERADSRTGTYHHGRQRPGY
jgi:hypothetical protein